MVCIVLEVNCIFSTSKLFGIMLYLIVKFNVAATYADAFSS